MFELFHHTFGLYAYDEKYFSYALIIEPTPGSTLFAFNLEKKAFKIYVLQFFDEKKMKLRHPCGWSVDFTWKCDETNFHNYYKMLTFHFKPLKYWRVDMRSHIFAAHRLQISEKCEIVLKKLLRMLFKVILNEDKWKSGSGNEWFESYQKGARVRVAVSVQSSAMEWQYHKRK